MIKHILKRCGYISEADAEADKKKAVEQAHNDDLANQAYAAVIAFSRACPGAGFKVVSANGDKQAQLERAKLLAKEVLEIHDTQDQELFSHQFVSCVGADVSTGVDLAS